MYYQVHWADFMDDDSATLHYQLAIGSAAGAQDIMPFTPVEGEFTVLSGDDYGMENGQAYFLGLKVLC